MKSTVGEREASGLHTYRAAGVDIDAADRFVDLIGPMVRRTYGPRVMNAHGGFAGAFRLDYHEKLFKRNYREPVLMACTDGVGSKLLIAIAAKRYDTVGIDLVAMNVNDLITTGAEPLFFLDYVAVNKLVPENVAAIVSGIVRGCEEAGCALLGGETAELPDLYSAGHFDLAGFAVGVVERRRLMSPKRVRPGDELIGLASAGLHSNGYALARKVLLGSAGYKLTDSPKPLDEPLVDALLRPTRIYVKPICDLLHSYSARVPVTGMAHITGSGLPGNVPRMLPPDCDAVIRRGSWPVPPIFRLIERKGVAEDEMYRVFNMGLGMVLAVQPRSTARVIKALEKAGETVFSIGRIRRGRGEMHLQ
jgi:phosphoribosylformylglycinamidine cyclo-ligase